MRVGQENFPAKRAERGVGGEHLKSLSDGIDGFMWAWLYVG